jgi:hypothetical protein
MGIIENAKDFFKGGEAGTGGGNGFSANTVIGLTALGNSKVENATAHGNEFLLMATLKDEGASSLRDASVESHIPIEKVKVLAKMLVSKGFARRVGANEGE